MTKLTGAIALFVVSCAVVPCAAAADTPVDTMRQLYMAAEYENALTALAAIDLASLPLPERVQVEGYHAACLVALGRAADAEGVMETIVKLDPRTVQPVDSSPKLRALFATVRARVLRQVVRDRYSRAKSLFDSKQFTEAQAAFEDVVGLLALSPPASGTDDSVDDVRTLAAEFAELSQAAVERARPAPAPAPEPPPVVVPAAPPPVVPSGPRIYGVGDSDVIPPITVSQQLQLTAAAARIAAARAPLIVYVVATISEKGQVEQATLSRPIDPVIDADLLASAKRWQYRPAQRNGVPVKYSKTVRLEVK